MPATSNNFMDVISPVDGDVISRVHLSSKNDLDLAVQAAKKAFPAWKNTTTKNRVQIMFRYKALLERDIDLLTDLIVEENGKLASEARAEIEKAIEIVEFASAMPQITTGETLEVSRGVECSSKREPLGVVASIAPLNFPMMVPHWTIPNCIALGNTMIFKPSEQVPVSSLHIAKLLKEAGLPDGVFNVVQGDKEVVEAICDHKDIKAVSFVGSTAIAKVVYIKASANLKRVLALGGAKNHVIVMPDAHLEMTASNVVASMSGCAGQRCMAASALVAVGAVDHIIDKIVEVAKTIIPGENLGAIVTAQSKERIERYITEAESAGAKIILDGRNAVVAGKEGGFYVGPTIIDHVTPDMAIAKEEVFGPVLSIMRVANISEAIEVENGSNYGNGAAVFTQSGAIAKEVSEKLEAGMIGINIGVPVPREPFAFGGINDSKFGVGDITGKSSIEFWTQTRKVTSKWNPEASINWMS
jgi:malonate-semialdehyde dehydrogenase (acetylating)/methylmalonate-semialdehyde dehydrogenase